jgi:hypothetical protein
MININNVIKETSKQTITKFPVKIATAPADYLTPSSPVVTLCSIRFNFQKFYVMYLECIDRVFVWISREESNFFPT